jgi:hypothetical protein
VGELAANREDERLPQVLLEEVLPLDIIPCPILGNCRRFFGLDDDGTGFDRVGGIDPRTGLALPGSRLGGFRSTPQLA